VRRLKKEVKVYSVDRKMVSYDEKTMFLVDVVNTGNGKYLCKGVDIDKNIVTDWYSIEDPNPAHRFGEILRQTEELNIK
jgi:hypothetical protein